MYLYSAYGTACDLSLLMISTVGGVADVGVYMRCKCKGVDRPVCATCTTMLYVVYNAWSIESLGSQARPR